MTGRFTGPATDEMTGEQRALYELFASGRRAQRGSPFSLVDGAGRLQGPPAAWVLVPPLARALERVGGTLRYELTLSARTREIVILCVAHHHRSPFELYAHTRAGAAAGLSPEDLDALAAGRPPALTTEEERVGHAVARRVLAAGTLDDEEFARAAGVLGPGGLLEVVTLIGWYSMVAVQLSVFGLMPPEPDEPDEPDEPGG